MIHDLHPMTMMMMMMVMMMKIVPLLCPIPVSLKRVLFCSGSLVAWLSAASCAARRARSYGESKTYGCSWSQQWMGFWMENPYKSRWFGVDDGQEKTLNWKWNLWNIWVFPKNRGKTPKYGWWKQWNTLFFNGWFWGIFGNIHLEVPLFFGNTQTPKGMTLQQK